MQKSSVRVVLVCILHLAGLWLAGNEGVDPYSSPYIIRYSVSIDFSIPAFPANQRPAPSTGWVGTLISASSANKHGQFHVNYRV